MESNELKHYGVLGMKWGVRRTPEQLGRHTIKKGTTMYRATADPNEQDSSGPRYVTYLDPDRDLYRGAWTSQILKNAGKSINDPIYEKKYKLNSDLKVAGRKDIERAVSEIAKDKQTAIENGKAYAKYFLQDDTYEMFDALDDLLVEKYGSGLLDDEPPEDFDRNYNKYAEEARKRYVNEYVKDFSSKSMDDIYMDTTRSFGVSEKNKKAVIDKLKKQGFHAMTDEAGVGSNETGREGVDPLIVFDAKSKLTTVSVDPVSRKEEIKAKKRYYKWQTVANNNRLKRGGEW